MSTSADRPTKLGRYELITRIGQGGMAEVQLAIQRGPAGFEKLVVVKLVHERLATQKTFVDMLLDEARVAALVKHPNVVDIYDLGEVDGRYYIAMEYLEGEPLLSVLRAGRDGKRLDVMSTARLIADTAEGLDAAHELRSLGGEALELVHHDVSLGNIVVLYTGQVKLVDFGVAKATQSQGARQQVQGKFSYMAPEKMRGEPGDRRSDIFSLGCVLWEALTLKRLFRGGNDTETMRQVLESVIVPPSQINPDVPDEFDPIVMRALEREAEHRYATAAELAADLEDLLRQHAYPRRNDAIAKYMNDVFKDHIAARKKLLQEVSSQGTASTEVLTQAFAEPAAPSGGGNDFSVKFKRNPTSTNTGAYTAYTEPPQAASGLLSLERPRRDSAQEPVPGQPILPAPLLPRTQTTSGDPTKVDKLVGTLAHAGAQPLIETDLARGLSGAVVDAPLADLADAMEPDRAPARGSTIHATSAPSSRRLWVLGGIALLLAGGVAAWRLLGRGASDDDDDAPPATARPHAKAPAAPPPDAHAAVPPMPSTDAPAGPPDAAAPSAVAPDAALGADAGPGPADAGAPPDSAPADPDDTAEAQVRIGVRQAARGEFTKALATLKHAQQLDPAFAPSERELGKLLYKMGQRSEARGHFQKYLQLAPSAADAPQIQSFLESL